MLINTNSQKKNQIKEQIELASELGTLTEQEGELVQRFRKERIIRKKETAAWKDLPPLLDSSSLLDWDIEDGQRAIIGQTYMEHSRNIRASVPLTSESEEKEIILKSGIKIWSVIQPAKLFKLQNGHWKSERWIPKVKNLEGKWIEADDTDCANWHNIPLDKRRVDFCHGVIPDSVTEIKERKTEKKYEWNREGWEEIEIEGEKRLVKVYRRGRSIYENDS